MRVKKICEVTIRVSEELKNAMHDVAAFEDRKPSEVWRIAAELYCFGHHHRATVSRIHDEPCTTTRGTT